MPVGGMAETRLVLVLAGGTQSSQDFPSMLLALDRPLEVY